MGEFYSEEEKKKAIFDSMSKKRQERIINKTTYAKWDPFEKPKDPIDIRTDNTNRTPIMLVREFLESRASLGEKGKGNYSSKYARGLLEMAIGLVNGDDRFVGMFEFSAWYKQLLEREGAERQF